MAAELEGRRRGCKKDRKKSEVEMMEIIIRKK
jgi:hypothetical protein